MSERVCEVSLLMLYVHEVDPVPVEIQSPEFRLLMKASESNLTCKMIRLQLIVCQLEHQDQVRKVIRELLSGNDTSR